MCAFIHRGVLPMGFFLKCFSLFLLIPLSQAKETCTYNTWVWSVRERKAVKFQRIQKDKSLLTPEERGPLEGCSLCEEDQKKITLPGIPGFFFCKLKAQELEKILLQFHKQGFPLNKVVGYRVGRSKGQVNAQGERTVFSFHSYGIALDINPEKNGLYENCPKFQSSCRLLQGGKYFPGSPGTLKAESALTLELKKLGYLWGGELKGQQKDFMHFSLREE